MFGLSITLKTIKLLLSLICWEKDLSAKTRQTPKLCQSVTQTIYLPKKIISKLRFGFKKEINLFFVTLLGKEIILFLEVLLALRVKYLNKSKKNWKNFKKPSIGIYTDGMNNFWTKNSRITMHMLLIFKDLKNGAKVINDLNVCNYNFLY